MKRIVWITDQPDWAYNVRAEAISRLLPQYEHRIVCYSREGFRRIEGADIVVCPDPRLLPFIGATPKVALNVNAVKIFASHNTP